MSSFTSDTVPPPPPGAGTTATPAAPAPAPQSSSTNEEPAPSAGPDATQPLQGKLIVEYPLTNFASNPHNVACIGFVLGGLFSAGIALALGLVTTKHLLWPPHASVDQLPPQGLVYALKSPVLGMYLSFWALFHLLEFVVTSMWNPAKLSVSSYLLDNGNAYHVAHVVGILEHVLETAYFPASLRRYKHSGPLFVQGMLLVVGGQILRSYAMKTASSNFSHAVAFSKLPTHQLVTTGIYSWFRHPSYAGFFWWAVGTQVLLGNPIGVLAFAAVLFKFFSSRIRVEERLLVKFFGDEYIKYREKVPAGILFVQ